MNENRGFTLVEVIGVIVVLSLITIVTVPSLTRTLKKNEQNKYNTYLNNVKIATENYFVRTILPEGEVTYSYDVTLGELIDAGYINETIINPNNSKTLSRDTIISVDKNIDGTFKYDIRECYKDGTCEGDE